MTGEELKQLRGKTTQEKFAKRVGIHVCTINRYEVGRSVIREKVAEKIQRRLDRHKAKKEQKRRTKLIELAKKLVKNRNEAAREMSMSSDWLDGIEEGVAEMLGSI